MKVEDIKTEVVESPQVLVLIGIPGSGKSTWKDKFLASTQDEYVVVSSDDFLEQIAAEKGLTYSEVHRDYIGMATGKSKQVFRDAIAGRKNIIHDQTNLSKKKRRGILQQLPKDYHKVAVVFDVPDNVLKDRLERRAVTTGKRIPQSVLDDMFKRWEAPTKDEGFAQIIKA